MTQAGSGQNISSLLAEGVTFVHADVFESEADRRYDVVFFGFWLSRVPLERCEEFWSRVEAWLEPGGRVFFVDDAHRTLEELIWGEASSMVQRRLPDGTTHRIVKVLNPGRSGLAARSGRPDRPISRPAAAGRQA